MPLDFVTPFDRAQHAPLADSRDLPPGPGWRRRIADACYLLVKAGGYLATTYLMTLGLPLLFFLAVSGGNAELFFAQLDNFTDRFLGAEPERRGEFVNQLTFTIVCLATLIGCLRLPRFLGEVGDGLREDKL